MKKITLAVMLAVSPLAHSYSAPETSALIAEQMSEAMAAADCDKDIAEAIITRNENHKNRLAKASEDIYDEPKKTSEVNCISGLATLDFGFNLPSASQLGKDMLAQFKDAACGIVQDESRKMISDLGLNFNVSPGGRYQIPGTNESIDVDVGSGGVNADSNVYRRGTNAGNARGRVNGSVGGETVINEERRVDTSEQESFLEGIF